MKDIYAEYDYGQLVLGDIIEPMRDGFSEGRFRIDPDTNKIKPRFRTAAEWDGPWFHVKHHPKAQCGVWNRTMFLYFNFIPEGCQGCWKVVVRPRYLEDLVKLLEIEIELDRPSKCGAELRPAVFGPWGGYFYNRSKGEGQKCYETVVKKCSEYEINFQPGFTGKPVLPLLKRGCTEMEHGIGPSDKWKSTPKEKILEKIIDHHIELPNYIQPKISKPHILRQWMDQAYSLGDPTVHKFNFNPPPSYVTYHKEAEDA